MRDTGGPKYNFGHTTGKHNPKKHQMSHGFQVVEKHQEGENKI